MHSGDNNEGNISATVEHVIEKANIEFTSMAYFRGRSIDDAVLIIDEAQNMCRRRLSAQPFTHNIAKFLNGNLRICTKSVRNFGFELIKAKSEKGYD